MADTAPTYRDKKTGKYYKEWRNSAGELLRQNVPKPSNSSHRIAENQARTPRTTRASSFSAESSTSQHRPSPDDLAARDAVVAGTTDAQYAGDEPQHENSDPSVFDSHGVTSSYATYHALGGYNRPQNEDSESQSISTIRELEAEMGELGLQERNYTTTTEVSGSTQYPPSRQHTFPPNRYVKGSVGQAEKLDPSYQIRNKDYKKFFRVGRVFSTLWTEGVGLDSGRVDPTFVSEVIYQEKVHSKVRRFVVVRYKENDTSCWCLPVTSYDGYGPKKRGITLGNHGFIYSDKLPKPVAGMLPRALKVNLSKGNTQLTDPSMVNYGKVYTVETNVKVKDVGDLDTHSKSILKDYFNYILNQEGADAGQMTAQPAAADLAHVGAGVEDTEGGRYNESSFAPRSFSHQAPYPYSATSNSTPVYNAGGTIKYGESSPYSAHFPNQSGYTPQPYQSYYGQNNVSVSPFYPDTSQYTSDTTLDVTEGNTTYPSQTDYSSSYSQTQSGNRFNDQAWTTESQQYSGYDEQAIAGDEGEIELPTADYVASHDPHTKNWRENKGKERSRSHRSGQKRR